MIFITSYHKSSWRIESRPIARYSTPAVDELLIRYLIYVFAFLRFLNHCMQYSVNRVFLFVEREKVWFLDRFDDQLKRQSALLLKFSINTRQWRHMIIGMNRRMCLGVSCKLYEVFQNFEKKALHAKEDFDSRLNEDFDNQSDAHPRVSSAAQFHVWQASHNPVTNVVSYGNDVDLRHGLIDSLLAVFRQVSLQWHRDIVQLSAPSEPASSHKRFSSRDLVDANSVLKRPRMRFKLQVRREL